MRSTKLLHAAAAFVVAGLAVTHDSQAAPFTPGNLLLTRAVGGTGTYDTNTGSMTTPTALAGSGVAATVVLDEYTPAGVFVQSIPMPNVKVPIGNPAGNRALTFSGTQNNDGAITVSGNNQYFVFAGYNQTAGAPGGALADGTNASPSTMVERVIGLVDFNGNINTTTALQDAASNQPIRSAYSTNGTDLWVGGSSGGNVTLNAVTYSSGGVRYTTLGSTTSTQLTAGNTNQRILNNFNNQLYMSSNASTQALRGINKIGTGFPTTGGPTVPIVQEPGFADTDSPNPALMRADDYWFFDANTLYIADQRTDANGGVQKWVFDDSDNDTILEWEFKYHVAMGNSDGPANPANLVGAHGLAGTTDFLGRPVLYATTFDGSGANRTRLVKVTDLGGSFSSVQTLAIAPDNGGFATAFRGVEIIPEPASLAALGMVGLLATRRQRRQRA